MKTFAQLMMEVAQPRSGDEINFKAKHEIEFMDHPASEEEQHTSEKKKAKRFADYDEREDMEVYESQSSWRVSIKGYGIATVKGANETQAIDRALSKLGVGKAFRMPYKSGKARKDVSVIKEEYFTEENMSDDQMDRRDKIVKGMEKNKEELKKRYGDKWKEVMYATATKQAMSEALNPTRLGDVLKKKVQNAKKGQTADLEKQIIDAGKNRTISSGEFEELEAAVFRKAKQLGEMYDANMPTAIEENKMKKYSAELEENFKKGSVSLKDGNTINLSKEDAAALDKLFSSMSDASKKKMQSSMSKDKKGFDEILSFAKEAL